METEKLLCKNLLETLIDQVAKRLEPSLKKIIQEILEEKGVSRKTPTVLITRNETAALLKISLPCLHRYTKLGIITGFKIGARVLYNKDDLLSNLTKIQSLKYISKDSSINNNFKK